MSGHRHLIDIIAWILAGVAAVSLSQLAYIATALAGFGSFALFLIKLYSIAKYGVRGGSD